MWANIASLTSEKVPLMRLLQGQSNSEELRHQLHLLMGCCATGSLTKRPCTLRVHGLAFFFFTGGERPLKAAYSEVISLGLILGTYGDPTQMMDSREQLHVDGQRQAFLERPGRARRHSNTDSSAHVRLFTGGCMIGGRGTRLWEALLRRAGRCGAVSACAVVDGRRGGGEVPHWLPSRRQRIKSQLDPRPSTLINY